MNVKSRSRRQSSSSSRRRTACKQTSMGQIQEVAWYSLSVQAGWEPSCGPSGRQGVNKVPEVDWVRSRRRGSRSIMVSIWSVGPRVGWSVVRAPAQCYGSVMKALLSSGGRKALTLYYIKLFKTFQNHWFKPHDIETLQSFKWNFLTNH